MIDLPSNPRLWHHLRINTLERGKMMYRAAKSSLEYGSTAPDPYKIIKINPIEIDHLVTPCFSSQFLYGTWTRGGDWDINFAQNLLNRWERTLIPIDNYKFYNMVHNRFVTGMSWDETDIDAYSESEEMKKKLDGLYNSILTNGYLPQTELSHRGDLRFPPDEHFEIVVNIGRGGELIFDEGKHRFFLARCLEVPEIPVRVLVRHRKWANFRYKIDNSKSTRMNVKNSNKLKRHPDLQDILSTTSD